MSPYGNPDDAERGGRRELRSALAVLLGAIVLLNLPPTYQDALAEGLRSTVLRPFLALQEGRVRSRVRSEEAAVLQARIDSLTALAVSGTTLAEENRRLRGLLELNQRLGPRWRAVQVLRPGTPDSESMLIVDAGLRDSIARGAPLITREGLAGVIRQVSANQAVGMDWTHPDFRASAMTVDGLQYGLVRSQAGVFREDTRLILDGLPYHAAVDSGTVIVTSGLGGVFPRGIPIGRTVTVQDSAAEWRKSFWVEPFVEAGSVTLALVGMPGLEPRADLSGGWNEDELLRAEERVRRNRLLADSVRILRDSLERLRIRLDSGAARPAGPGGAR